MEFSATDPRHCTGPLAKYHTSVLALKTHLVTKYWRLELVLTWNSDRHKNDGNCKWFTQYVSGDKFDV